MTYPYNQVKRTKLSPQHQRLERMDSLTKANVPPTQTLSLIDDRLNIDKTVHSDGDETLEKPKRPLKRPLPDDGDLYSLGSYNKPIPKKSKNVERFHQQNASKFQQLRNEIHLLRTKQRHMSHNTKYKPKKRQRPNVPFVRFQTSRVILWPSAT